LGSSSLFGIDDSDCEILPLISGHIQGNDGLELESYMWVGQNACVLTRLKRRLHNATEGYTLITKGRWQLSYTEDDEHEVFAALNNVVFQKEAPVSLIDIDMAGPSPRMWDIA